ncbi:vigilin [Nephila pilipes]|uniref:Vigilin n=1 Tax=Nephila pilipes TaxID=299642 RepID=A0A8X6T8V8_NEPPI|nr:vigilin [Nephila pilipes]
MPVVAPSLKAAKPKMSVTASSTKRGRGEKKPSYTRVLSNLASQSSSHPQLFGNLILRQTLVEYGKLWNRPLNETINQIIRGIKARINIPSASVMKNELNFAGETEAIAKANDRIQNIYEEQKRNCRSVFVEVPKNQHKYIIGPYGQIIQEILLETDVSVEMPPPDVQSDTTTLRGEQAKLGYALTLVYSKANSG